MIIYIIIIYIYIYISLRGMLSNALECSRMLSNALECSRMLSNARRGWSFLRMIIAMINDPSFRQV